MVDASASLGAGTEAEVCASKLGVLSRGELVLWRGTYAGLVLGALLSEGRFLPARMVFLTQQSNLVAMLFAVCAGAAGAAEPGSERARRLAGRARALASVPLFAAPLVSTVYWALLWPRSDAARSGDLPSWRNVTFHGLNLVFVLADVAVSSVVPTRRDLAVGVAYGVCYVVFAYVFRALGGFWTYFFLHAYDGAAQAFFDAFLFVLAALLHAASVLVTARARDALAERRRGYSALDQGVELGEVSSSSGG